MFVIREKNDEGKIGVLDTRDNAVDYFTREQIIIYHEDFGIDYTNYDELESIAKVDNVQNNTEFDDDLFNSAQEVEVPTYSSDDLFNSEQEVEIPNYNFNDVISSEDFERGGDFDSDFVRPTPTASTHNQEESISNTQTNINNTPIQQVQNSIPMDANTLQPIVAQINQDQQILPNPIIELINSVVSTFQDEIIELNVNDSVNQSNIKFVTALYYINLPDKVILFNLHKYDDLDKLGLPNYCVGYIDKNTRIFREMYNSDSPFFFTHRTNYVVLIKRDERMTINKIDLRTFKTRIIGNPIKLKHAIINLINTDQDDYFFVSIMSIKSGSIGFMLLIDMSLKGVYYPYKINSDDISEWFNDNVYYRLRLEESFKTICSCESIIIKSLNISDVIDIKFITDVTRDDKVMHITYAKSLESSNASIEQLN